MFIYIYCLLILHLGVGINYIFLVSFDVPADLTFKILVTGYKINGYRQGFIDKKGGTNCSFGGICMVSITTCKCILTQNMILNLMCFMFVWTS